MSGWISVDDELPTDGDWVLAKFKPTPFNESGMVVTSFSLCVKPNFQHDRISTCKVTHWMPLPEPPSND
jgi:hypothetical protein